MNARLSFPVARPVCSVELKYNYVLHARLVVDGQCVRHVCHFYSTVAAIHSAYDSFVRSKQYNQVIPRGVFSPTLNTYFLK